MLTASGQAIAIGFRTCPQLVSTTTYTQVVHASQLLAVAILVQSGYSIDHATAKLETSFCVFQIIFGIKVRIINIPETQ